MENSSDLPYTLSNFLYLAINCSHQKLWEVFGACSWLNEEGATYENRLGGALVHPASELEAEVTHFAPGRRVVWQLYVKKQLSTTVEFQIAWDGSKTHLAFREDGWEQVPDESRHEASRKKWDARLKNLKQLCESSEDAVEKENGAPLPAT